MEKGDIDLSKLLRDISKTKNLSMSMIIYYWTEMLKAVKDIHDKGNNIFNNHIFQIGVKFCFPTKFSIVAV